MAFVPEKAKEIQQQQFDGQWKSCRRTGAEVLMSHPANPEFLREMRRLEKIERANLGLVGRNIDKPLPEEVLERINAEAISRKLLKDWRRVETSDHQPIPFDSKIACEFLKNIVAFRLDVMDLISAAADEEADEREAVSGN